jgi:hypothetical protein
MVACPRQFPLLNQLPLKTMLVLKVVKNDFKNNHLCLLKSVKIRAVVPFSNHLINA